MAERNVKRAILDVLAARNIIAWSNPRNAFTRSGFPDISGVLPGGRALFIEAKDQGKYDEAKEGLHHTQEWWAQRLHKTGALVIVTDSAQEVADLVDLFLAVGAT